MEVQSKLHLQVEVKFPSLTLKWNLMLVLDRFRDDPNLISFWLLDCLLS